MSKVDYLSVVIPLDYFAEEALSQALSMFAKHKPVKWINGKEQFKKGLMYEQKDLGWWLKIQCCPYKNHEHKSRVSFNYLNAEGLKSIAALINKLFPGGYRRIIEQGHITRVDFAVDFQGVTPSDFLWGASHNYIKCLEIINDNTGKLETIYIGSKTSAKYVVIYDRTAAKKVPSKASGISACDIPEYDVTRVEVRLQPDSILPFTQINKLTKALDTVHVLAASSSQKDVQSSLELLMRVGNQRFLLKNIAMAEQFLPVSVCESYRKHLTANSIGNLCNHLKEPISELLAAHHLVA